MGGARNPELEAAIRAAVAGGSDAVEPFLVYGDWLQAQGDPRGELVAVQAKRLADPNDPALRDAEARILATHRAALVGDLPLGDGASVVWRLGFLREVRIGAYDDVGVAELYRVLLAHPSAAFVHKLTIGAAVIGDENRYDDVWEAIDEVGLPETLRELFVGDFEVDESELSWSHMGDVSPLWRHAGRLERLKLRCGSFELGRIAAPSLRRFEIETGGLTKANWRSIVEADWPALESLAVYFGDSNYGADCDVDDVRPLLDGKAPAGLRDLGLMNCEFGDELAAAVAGSVILPRLRTLSLAKGTMGEAGAQAILSSKKAFAHLETLDLSENYIPEALLAELRSFCDDVIDGQRAVDGQYDPEARYVVVGE